MVCIACDRKPDLFSAAYLCFVELIEEYRRKFRDAGINIGDFPLERYICRISGVYYC